MYNKPTPRLLIGCAFLIILACAISTLLYQYELLPPKVIAFGNEYGTSASSTLYPVGVVLTVISFLFWLACSTVGFKKKWNIPAIAGCLILTVDQGLAAYSLIQTLTASNVYLLMDAQRMNFGVVGLIVNAVLPLLAYILLIIKADASKAEKGIASLYFIIFAIASLYLSYLPWFVAVRAICAAGLMAAFFVHPTKPNA